HVEKRGSDVVPRWSRTCGAPPRMKMRTARGIFRAGQGARSSLCHSEPPAGVTRDAVRTSPPDRPRHPGADRPPPVGRRARHAGAERRRDRPAGDRIRATGLSPGVDGDKGVWWATTDGWLPLDALQHVPAEAAPQYTLPKPEEALHGWWGQLNDTANVRAAPK